MIELIHLEKKYENATPLRDVNTVINDGDVISVIGPSGTGKSTLIRCINMLERPTGGQILLDGVDITAPGYDVTLARRRMGMVFQSFNLFGHLTVIENICLAPVELLHCSRQEACDRGMRLLKQVGLQSKALSYPDELSGGQKQRIAIARTLAMDPDIILFDEPTSALDPTMVGEVQAVIHDLATTGKTLMIVTHEMAFAKAVSNRVFYMDEGGIYEDGTPEQIFDSPQRENTRRFIYRLRVLSIDIKSRDFDFVEASNSIDNYCEKNRIAVKTSNRVQSVFEELCLNMLMSAMPEPDITAIVEYSEKTDELDMQVSYSGPVIDIENTEDDLALMLLKGRTKSITYETVEGDHPNLIRILVKT